MSRATLTAEAVAAQRQVIRALLDAALGDLLELDLSMAQLKALAAMQRQPNCSIGMLSEQLGTKPPATSLLVDKLVRSGLAYRERDSGDGRRVIVQPTAKGANLVGRIRHGTQAVLEKWIGLLVDDDLVALRKGSSALATVAVGLPQSRLADDSRLTPTRGRH